MKWLAVIGLVLTGTASAGELQITEAWSPEAPQAARSRAAYVSLENTGETVGVTGASAESFAMVHLHETRMLADGIMSMSPVDEITIEAGATLTMEPGGLHIMLMGATGDVPDPIPLTLELSDGTTLEVEAEIRKRGGS